MAESPLVTVTVFRDPWEAHIVSGLLRSEDVMAFVIHDQHIWMKWPISTALGGVKIQVPVSQRETALRILGAWSDGEFAGLLEDYQSPYHLGPCPRCKSADFTPVFSVLDWLSLLVLAYPARRHWNFCRRCSYIWNRELPA